jgi:hypothetical protein
MDAEAREGRAGGASRDADACRKPYLRQGLRRGACFGRFLSCGAGGCSVFVLATVRPVF